MLDRRAVLRSLAAALTPVGAVAAPAPRRREWRIGGRRIKTVDIHAHIAADVAEAVAGTAYEARNTANLRQYGSIDEARIARMDRMGIDVQVVSVNPFWYEMDRTLAGRTAPLLVLTIPDSGERIRRELDRRYLAREGA